MCNHKLENINGIQITQKHRIVVQADTPVGIVFLSLCAVVTVWSVWNSYRFAEKQREKIYVLDNGKSLMLALSQDLSQNRPAEAREHVRRFHEMFFTLSPEKSAIEHNVKRALLLADKKRVPLLFGLRGEGR